MYMYEFSFQDLTPIFLLPSIGTSRLIRRRHGGAYRYVFIHINVYIYTSMHACICV